MKAKRRPGRPRVSDVALTARLPTETYELLTAYASARGWSLGRAIRQLLPVALELASATGSAQRGSQPVRT